MEVSVPVRVVHLQVLCPCEGGEREVAEIRQEELLELLRNMLLCLESISRPLIIHTYSFFRRQSGKIKRYRNQRFL